MVFWMIVISLFVAILSILQVASMRQIGLMLARLGPIGARSSEDEGPRKGEHIGLYMNSLKMNIEVPVRGVLYLFGSTRCSICEDVRRSADSLSGLWHSDVAIVMIYDEQQPERAREGEASKHIDVVYDGESIRLSLGIDGVPYGVRVDPTGCVIGKGLVNSISHIESLLEIERDDRTIILANGSNSDEVAALHQSALAEA